MEIKKQAQVLTPILYSSANIEGNCWFQSRYLTDGYFACSVGNVSEEMLKRYIENQG